MFLEGKPAFPLDSTSRWCEVGLQGFGERSGSGARRRSSAPSSCAKSAGCWREDGPSLEKRESGARAWPGYITFCSELRNKGRAGARGLDPKERPPGQRRGCHGYLGELGAAGVRPAAAWEGWAGRLDPLLCPGESRARLTRAGYELGAGLPTGAAGAPSPRSEGQKCQLEMSPGDPDPSLVADVGGPIRPGAAPVGGSPLPPVSERRGSGALRAALRGPAAHDCPVFGRWAAAAHNSARVAAKRTGPAPRLSQWSARVLLTPCGSHQSPSPPPNLGLTALGPAGVALILDPTLTRPRVPATLANKGEAFPAPALHPLHSRHPTPSYLGKGGALTRGSARPAAPALGDLPPSPTPGGQPACPH